MGGTLSRLAPGSLKAGLPGTIFPGKSGEPAPTAAQEEPAKVAGRLLVRTSY